MLKVENVKGTRDFPPEEKILRDKVLSTIKEVFELYGYAPLETPMVMTWDVLAAKFAAGESSDAMKEIFKVTDNGKRKLGLRFDLTVPLSKFVALNPNLKLPFKRYEIGRVYRDGPIKLGRYREFWQCDFDIVGKCNEALADAEIPALSAEVFKRLGFKVDIKVNSRKILSGILEDAGIKKNQEQALIAIDKLAKIGLDGVKKELKQRKFTSKQIDSVLDVIELKSSNKQMIKALEKEMKSNVGKEGIEDMKNLFEYLDVMGVAVDFDISLARGLAYYTGMICEVFLKDSSITNSVEGGGRYNNLIGQYLGKGDYPACGISFGIEPIMEAMKLKENTSRRSPADVFIIPIKAQKEALEIAQDLRRQGVKTDMDLVGRGPSKNLDYASSLGIPFVVFVGKRELEKGKVKLRDMKTGKETMVGIKKLDRLAKEINKL